MMRLGILSSHEGSLLQLVLDSCANGKIPASVNLVISNNSKSRAYQRAIEVGATTLHLSSQTHSDPEHLDQAMLHALIDHDVNLVLLAGFMRKIGPATLAFFQGRIINTHPSLLPRFGGQGFYGRQVHTAVLASGEKETGASVHHVTEHYDEGGIISQIRVPIYPEDTVENIENRVKKSERQLLVNTLIDLTRTAEPNIQD